ncbi:F0F1 ATP synthase subunit A [Simplicispira suum]|uniref:ATP synthase subunit a n=1 Tax=Simplicispira suum TaxID=2109915 RepID=A0A2S0MXZ4_9BURK|nr:F0F1 ATP synthase subunit A [Simplicispira suum]AVO40758.1 ATP synthase F0 subunit A [Simplicispira suum]
MTTNPFLHEVLLQLGPLAITTPVVTTWALMLVLVLGAAWLRNRLSVRAPGRVQSMAEAAFELVQTEMRSTMNTDPAPFLPLIATLFVFILTANLSGLIPGVVPPTAALETDLALALSVFAAVLGWGIGRRGLWGYLRSYAQPSLLLLPLNLIEALTRIVSMSVRLFGNMMSGVVISAVVLGLAGLLVPVPFMALELLSGLIQAYIFTVLAMVFIAAAASEPSQPE